MASSSRDDDDPSTGVDRPGRRASRLNFLVGLIASAFLVALSFVAVQQPPRGNSWEPAPSLTRLDGWRVPVERNRFLRLPSLQSDISGFHVSADRLRAWAVGGRGSILATRDGGATWQPQTSGTASTLWSVVVTTDGQRGWVVGAAGTILRTRDGGNTWQAQKSGTESSLWSIAMATDGQWGWAVGDVGTILATRDGGTTWRAQTSGTPTGLRSVAMAADGQRGWAVGDAGTILTTRDGGSTWQRQVVAGTTTPLWSVAITADGGQAWAVGDGGLILATRNGGTDWQEQASGTRTALKSVAMAADGRRGWAVGDRGTVVTTRDAGKEWRSQTSGTRSQLWSVGMMPDGQRGWAAGRDGTILWTRDSGVTWQPQTIGARGNLISVAMATDGQLGWVVGRDGTILATRDGGGTWQAQTAGRGNDLTSVAVTSDGQRGWAVGDDGTILATRDGGTSWHAQTSGTKSDLWSVAMTADGQRGWAVGDDGTILATRDGGTTWEAQTSGTRSDLWSVAMTADGQRAWAIGWDGTISTTVDGGTTWQGQRVKTLRSVVSAAAMTADGQRGWVIGGNEILATRDGGATWQAQTSRRESSPTFVAMTADGQRGWAVGDDGAILATRDGGTTWQAQTSGTRSDLWSVAMTVDGQRGWTVGRDGTILTTRDAGVTWLQATYQKRPAPWFYPVALVMISLAAVFIVRNIRKAKLAARAQSITDKGWTDEPVSRPDQDRLGFTPLVLGLTRYLRNIETRPPLTIAVSAPWGRGKSSVMRMLMTELSQGGVRCVWFNPWHQQKEAVLLAPLLESIRREAIPSMMSWYGLRFRARLLLRRIRSHPYGAGALTAALVLPALHFQLYRVLPYLIDRGGTTMVLDGLTQLWHSIEQSVTLSKLGEAKPLELLGALLQAVFGRPEQFVDAVAIVVFLVGLGLFFIHGLRTFPEKPAVLLASLANRSKLVNIEAQTGFRQRFQDNFSDICESLVPRTMTIFIDDLDRCEPAKAAEVLEAVNYLVNSGGRCFVVLGMARDVVEAQLAVHYKDLAEEYERMPAPPAGMAEQAPAGPDAGLEYARRYLRKLVNLEIRLPELTPEDVRRLTNDERPAHVAETRWLRAARRLDRVVSAHGRRVAAGLAFLIATGYGIFSIYGDLENWDNRRKVEAQRARGAMEKQLGDIREAEGATSVALDFARGKEKRIASELYNRHGYVLAGLDLRLPAQEGKQTIWNVVDLCPSAPRTPGSPAVAPRVEDRSRKAELSRQELIDCWRQLSEQARKAEHFSADAKAAHAAAITAKEREDFRRLEKAVKNAQTAADHAVTAVELPKAVVAARQPAASASGSQRLPSAVTRQGGGQTLSYHHDPPAQWPYVLFAGPMLAIGIAALMRKDRYLIADRPEFVSALEIWDRLLGADRDVNTPREVKRFVNRTRYYAMRLRAAPENAGPVTRILERFNRNGETADVSTSLPESVIVALAAIYQVRPQWFGEKVIFVGVGIPATEDGQLYNLFVQLRQQHLDRFTKWPSQPSDLAGFLKVVGEFVDSRSPKGVSESASPE